MLQALALPASGALARPAPAAKPRGARGRVAGRHAGAALRATAHAAHAPRGRHAEPAGRALRTQAHATARGLPLARASSNGSSAGLADAGKPNVDSSGLSSLAVAVIASALAVLACGALYKFVPGINQTLVDTLAKSGFTAAFGLIFVSEIGDKTFFIAALLAMRRGRAIVMAGAVAALALMTGISVALGRLFTRLPDSLSSSLPLGEYCAAALLLFFGVKALKDALAMKPETAGDGETDELEEAAAVVKKAEAEGKEGILAGFLQTFSLIFVAEWGDRSMLATIALGAAQNPLGVFAGAVLGHTLATLIAVVGGSLLSARISERTVGIAGGVLFLIFAAATLLGVF